MDENLAQWAASGEVNRLAVIKERYGDGEQARAVGSSLLTYATLVGRDGLSEAGVQTLSQLEGLVEKISENPELAQKMVIGVLEELRVRRLIGS